MRAAAAAILILTALAASAGGLNLDASMGISYPVGAWGDNIGSGIGTRALALWKATERLGAGAGLGLTLYGDDWEGDASLSRLAPQLVARGVLRPGAASFEPGLEVGVGMSRSRLGSSGGVDPASWDPFWRAGLRWGFGLGEGFRGGIGFDFSGVLSDVETAESFEILFSVGREVGTPW